MKTQSRSILRATICALALVSLLTYPLTAFANNSISVQVTCKIGVGVSNVTVQLIPRNPNKPGYKFSTDKNGRVQFHNFDDGVYDIVVTCGSATFTHEIYTGAGLASFSHDYLFRCCPTPPGAPPAPDGLIGIDGKSVSDAETASSRAASKAGVVTAQGLHRATFDTLEGRVIVNLPDDMRAGDTISGTVVSEPKRGTPQEMAEHQAKMSLYNIKLRTAKTLSGPSDLDVTIPLSAAITPFTFNIPNTTSVAGTSPTNIFPWVAAGDPGRVAVAWYGSNTGVPVNPTPWTEYVSKTVSTDFSLSSEMGQQGRPMQWFGPLGIGSPILMYGPARSSIQDFEKNTENVSGGFGLINVLAGSPRTCVFEAPTTVTGPVELYLKAGNVQTTAPYRNVGVKLSAPKTDLLKGEKTTLTVEVNGLEGIKKPVPLTLTYQGVITMEGGPYQPLTIQPSQVSADGRYSTTRGITGVQPGGWGATATVVVQPFDICLQDDSVPARVVLWNTFTGDYKFTDISSTGSGGPGINLTNPGGGGLAVSGEPVKPGAATETGAPAKPGGAGQTVNPNPPGGITVTPSDVMTPTGGFNLTGTGTIARKGCIITLTHNAPDRRVFAKLDPCTNSGTTSIEAPIPKTKFTITDRNTADNTCACGPGCR